MSTSPTPCMPGAAHTACVTWPGCTASTPAASCGHDPRPTLLIDANTQATAARAAGQATLGDAQLARIRSWYRGAVAKGLADNAGKTTQIARDALTLARRFRDHEDMILRFTTDLAWLPPAAAPP